MSHTLYATFAQPEEAEKAAGALLDRGVRAEDLSVVRQPHEGYNTVTEPQTTASNVIAPVPEDAERVEVENVDRDEIDDPVAVRDTRGDAEAGAVKGGLIGAGIGAVAVIASLIVPGVGFVIGAGALASGLIGVAATAGAGAATGALVANLKAMGVEEERADEYGRTVEGGGAILAVTVPSGTVEEEAANAVLRENGATNINRYAAREPIA